MATKTLYERSDSIHRVYEDELTKQRHRCEFWIGRGANALTVLLFGLGVLVLVIGLCTDLYSAGIGVVGWIALWVAGYTVRTYCGSREYLDIPRT
jgi:hypothetical protein